MTDFSYDAWPSRAGIDWGPGAERGDSEWDAIDFHVDLGCGNRPKGRIGVDRYVAPGVAIVADLDTIMGPLTFATADTPGEDAVLLDAPAPGGMHRAHTRGLPFGDSSVKSIISHHAFEHVGEGFIALIEECYRVLEPDGVLRAITPLFPSRTAVEDVDHCRMIMEGTWECFCGWPDVPHWTASFSVPYTTARFELIDKDMTPPVECWEDQWGPKDAREIRVALKAQK